MPRFLRRRRPRERDIHVFLIWPTALGHADRILADIERNFRIHELIRVRWSRERFGENLGRFYGPQLPPGVDKLTETGAGEFLVAVVSDPSPSYRLRARTLGKERVNVHVFDAKQRYRSWTGGGHLVHATNDRAEAERDLFLLFGRTVAGVAETDRREQTVERDLIGAQGWASFAEMLTAMEHSGGYALLNPSSSDPPLLLTHAEWAVEILRARRVDGMYEVTIADASAPLEVSWVGDRRLPSHWQEAILGDAMRSADGALVATPGDQFYAEVHRVLEAGARPSAAQGLELQRLAELADAESGDYGDPLFLSTSLAAFLERRRST